MSCDVQALNGLGGCTPAVTTTPIWYLDADNCAVSGTKVVTVTCDPALVVTTYLDNTGGTIVGEPKQLAVNFSVPVICPPNDITIAGQNCAGGTVNVTGLEGQITRTVPHPTAVQPSKDCNSDAILAAVDGLETLVGSTNTLLGTNNTSTTATNTALGTVNTNLTTLNTSVNTRLPAATTPGLLPVDALATPLVPRNQNTSAAATAIVLTTTARRISMYATAGTWYSLTGTATSASHYIAASERLDFNVPASTTVSVLQETTAGVVRISELG